MDSDTESVIYKEEKLIKKKNKNVKNIVFSPNSLFLLSLNHFDQNTGENNLFLFSRSGNDTAPQWKLLESFKEDAGAADVKFVSDSTFQGKIIA